MQEKLRRYNAHPHELPQLPNGLRETISHVAEPPHRLGTTPR